MATPDIEITPNAENAEHDQAISITGDVRYAAAGSFGSPIAPPAEGVPVQAAVSCEQLMQGIQALADRCADLHARLSAAELALELE